MLFCSYEFLAFFLVVFCLYWAIPGPRARVWLLLAASYFFYACWNQWLAVLIFASATADYLLARGLDALEDPRARKALVAASVIANLGLLCYFKYVNFFLDSLTQTLHVCGVRASLPVLQVMLPVGISFYTFEAINYTVDVYRRKLPAEKNLAHLLLFILFFPHLVAGPIVRARDFLPQIRRRKRWSWLRAQAGVQLILLGLVKKLVIADRLALLVDPVFADPAAYRPEVGWMAMVGYAFQLYGDFSGYSDLAMGTAYLLGYHLAKNFDLPYLAANFAEFWRRWHMSLSGWLRDYLFIPLGGSRGGSWKTARNLVLTMTLCGLWHGATWSCVLFGLLHGLLLVAHRGFRTACENWPRLRAVLETGPGTAARIALTFLVFCLSLVVFRSPSLASAGTYFARLVTPAPDALAEPLPAITIMIVTAIMAIGHALGRSGAWDRLAGRLPAEALSTAYGVGLSLILVLAPPAGQPFIYFQF